MVLAQELFNYVISGLHRKNKSAKRCETCSLLYLFVLNNDFQKYSRDHNGAQLQTV